MARRSRLVFLLAATVAILLIPCAENLLAQDGATVEYKRGPGGYLSWWKLLLITIVFVLFVKMADWINRDTMKIGERISMSGEFWNPMTVFPFLIGFMCIISIPIFWVGLPIYLIAAFVPFLCYFMTRRRRFKADPTAKQYLTLKPGEVPQGEALPQDDGVAIDFTPAGDDAASRQANLIRSRQSESYLEFKELLKLTQFKRAEQILMDFTRESVNSRILVDGTWHPLDPMDRVQGDAVLTSLKDMAGLNPAERRARQSGGFKFKSEIGKAAVSVTSQGVPTGERVQVKYELSAKETLAFPQLGMFPEMVEQIKTSLNKPGTTIISAPPGSGLTSSWQGALVTADRLTRDCVAVITEDESESVLENIVIHRYDESVDSKKQLEILKAMLLTQPDMLAIPKVENKEVMDLLTKQVTTQDRSLVLRMPAKSAAEALLRSYALAGNRDQFLKAINNVTCQRLVRRLCTTCRTEVRVQPKIIQQLGGDPNKQTTVYNPWKLPPPEQRVDERGKEIEFPPCETCGGIGYIGRIAVFEMITLNDQLREFIKKNPQVAAVEQAATKLGKTPLANQAYKLVLLGVTSLAEAQRVLKEK
jgi:type II secretory ATPase GspE/PulE/Tfp pilus assembly ATPase PilB-like protein